jgi:hypothetical protein
LQADAAWSCSATKAYRRGNIAPGPAGGARKGTSAPGIFIKERAMKTIWKFPLKITDRQTVAMPIGARVLSVQFQVQFQGDHSLCLWAVVNPDNPMEPRTIQIHGTGHACPEADVLTFIGTVQQHGGQLVWHVFEVPAP